MVPVSDDLAVEGEPVDDGGAESGVGGGLGPAGERLVGGDRDGRFLLPLGEDLEQQLGPAAVQLEVSELVADEEIDAAVASDRLGRCLSSAASTSSLTSLDAST